MRSSLGKLARPAELSSVYMKLGALQRAFMNVLPSWFYPTGFPGNLQPESLSDSQARRTSLTRYALTAAKGCGAMDAILASIHALSVPGEYDKLHAQVTVPLVRLFGRLHSPQLGEGAITERRARPAAPARPVLCPLPPPLYTHEPIACEVAVMLVLEHEYEETRRNIEAARRSRA